MMRCAPLLLVASCLLLSAAADLTSTTRPHIVIIVADDMGWNDVSFHGSDQIPTPNIDALAYHGLILNNHYAQAICTPSRAALMTGKYPIRTGMQSDPIIAAEPRGLPPGKILPQYLKDLGYVTRAVGKWHLGYHRKEYTPTYRGFDSFFGYWNGFVGYYDYILQAGKQNGYDLRRNLTTSWEESGRYSTDVFTEEAERLVAEHDVSRPLFLYLAHLACHAGNAAGLLQAPQEYVNRFGHITDPSRRLYAGVMAKLDESVGRVVAALEQRGMLDNSIILFMADNGAPTIGVYPNWGSNYPLRGLKETLYEGGIRSASVLWSPLLQFTPRVSNQLLHVSDWLPTLYVAAGGDPAALPTDLDGLDAWKSLVTGGKSPRTEVLINVDDLTMTAAMRVGDWKVIGGSTQNGSLDGYYGDSGFEEGTRNPPYNLTAVVTSPAGTATARAVGATPEAQMARLRRNATVTCLLPPGTPPRCQPRSPSDICTFNVAVDPCEQFGKLNDDSSWITNYLLDRISELRLPTVLPANVPLQEELADPLRWSNTWTPWTDCLNSLEPFCNMS